MPIDTTCQTCGKRLRVADEHAGKTARCPGCQTIYTVPAASAFQQPMVWQAAPVLAGGSGGPESRWHLKTPDGLSYGPVSKADLDQWVQQGRITAQSQLCSEADSRWFWAGQLYPQLGTFAQDAPPAAVPNPYAPPGAGSYHWMASRYREQHRGPVILVLSIVGIFVCDIASLIAIVMAIIDLNKMSQGTMDPAGRGLTIAGLVIASLKLLFFLGLIVLMILGNL
jgi:hypothetical protein